jgi:hypothetical protein
MVKDLFLSIQTQVEHAVAVKVFHYKRYGIY